jgi:hypothetical protein
MPAGEKGVDRWQTILRWISKKEHTDDDAYEASGMSLHRVLVLSNKGRLADGQTKPTLPSDKSAGERFSRAEFE